MAFVDIGYKGSPLTIHKAITHPHFGEKTVLVTDTWDYVDLWLRRSKQDKARFFWQQAHSFYDATRALPKISSPLPAYYCFLNATKAMLIAKGVNFGDQHGVSGYTTPGRTSLSNEIVKFQAGGILAALCTHLGEPANGVTYSLADLLYNLPYVHRAYDLTFESSKELFIPISCPRIVKSSKTHEAWFVAELSGKYAIQKTIAKLPNGYEQELGDPSKFMIRRKSRFNWTGNDRTSSISRYRTYHKAIRSQVHYICGPQRLWYIKRGGNIASIIPRSSLTLAFAAMHKLSELSRYTPDRLARHFDCQHNWLLSEFIESAPAQFLDEISSEMTGREFMPPGRASRK
jgi:hypothetical protein